MLKVQHVEQAYQQLLVKLARGQAIPEEVRNIRWMIEELRISSLLRCWARHTQYQISGFAGH